MPNRPDENQDEQDDVAEPSKPAAASALEAQSLQPIRPLERVVLAQRVMSFAGKDLKKHLQLSTVTNTWRDALENYPTSFYQSLLQPNLKSLGGKSAQEIFFAYPFARKPEYLALPATNHEELLALFDNSGEHRHELLRWKDAQSLIDGDDVKASLAVLHEFTAKYGIPNAAQAVVDKDVADTRTAADIANRAEMDDRVWQELANYYHLLMRWACINGHTAVVNALFAQYMELDRSGARLQEALQAVEHYALRWACRKGHTAIVNALLAQYMELDRSGARLQQEALQADRHGALRWACERGNPAIVNALLAQYLELDRSGELMQEAMDAARIDADTGGAPVMAEFLKADIKFLQIEIADYQHHNSALGRDHNLTAATGAEYLLDHLKLVTSNNDESLLKCLHHVQGMLAMENRHNYFAAPFDNYQLHEFYVRAKLLLEEYANNNNLRIPTNQNYDDLKIELAIRELQVHQRDLQAAESSPSPVAGTSKDKIDAIDYAITTLSSLAPSEIVGDKLTTVLATLQTAGIDIASMAGKKSFTFTTEKAKQAAPLNTTTAPESKSDDTLQQQDKSGQQQSAELLRKSLPAEADNPLKSSGESTLAQPAAAEPFKENIILLQSQITAYKNNKSAYGRDPNLIKATGAEYLFDKLNLVAANNDPQQTQEKLQQCRTHVVAMLQMQDSHDYFEAFFGNSKLKELYVQADKLLEQYHNSLGMTLSPVSDNNMKVEIAIMELEKYKLHLQSAERNGKDTAVNAQGHSTGKIAAVEQAITNLSRRAQTEENAANKLSTALKDLETAKIDFRSTTGEKGSILTTEGARVLRRLKRL